MGATRPHNPAARGTAWALPRPGKIGAESKKNKPALNTKLRILPVEAAELEPSGRSCCQPGYCPTLSSIGRCSSPSMNKSAPLLSS